VDQSADQPQFLFHAAREVLCFSADKGARSANRSKPCRFFLFFPFGTDRGPHRNGCFQGRSGPRTARTVAGDSRPSLSETPHPCGYRSLQRWLTPVGRKDPAKHPDRRGFPRGVGPTRPKISPSSPPDSAHEPRQESKVLSSGWFGWRT